VQRLVDAREPPDRRLRPRIDPRVVGRGHAQAAGRHGLPPPHHPREPGERRVGALLDRADDVDAVQRGERRPQQRVLAGDGHRREVERHLARERVAAEGGDGGRDLGDRAREVPGLVVAHERLGGGVLGEGEEVEAGGVDVLVQRVLGLPPHVPEVRPGAGRRGRGAW
jgi:hypothetical protein